MPYYDGDVEFDHEISDDALIDNADDTVDFSIEDEPAGLFESGVSLGENLNGRNAYYFYVDGGIAIYIGARDEVEARISSLREDQC